MKKNYISPVLEIEGLVTEEIMNEFNPENILSYNEATGWGGYNDTTGLIKFQGNPNNMLNSINYEDFAN